MTTDTRLLDTRTGRFACRDFGGEGPDLLFVHGTGHDLEVWQPLAEALRGRFRMAAFDLRGHGQTPEESTDPEQYWRDIAAVAAALAMPRPLLVGHSTGGYAVTAHAAAGGACAGIVALDGFVLDGRLTPEEAKAWYLPQEQLWDLFRYGWEATSDEMDAYVREVCRRAPADWLNAGVDVALVEAVTRRAFLPQGATWRRRPRMEEIARVSVPDPARPIYPARDLYDQVRVPAGFVLASAGLYGNREADLRAVVAAAPDRHFLKLEGGHNIHMLQAAAIADFITAHFR